MKLDYAINLCEGLINNRSDSAYDKAIRAVLDEVERLRGDLEVAHAEAERPKLDLAAAMATAAELHRELDADGGWHVRKVKR